MCQLFLKVACMLYIFTTTMIKTIEKLLAAAATTITTTKLHLEKQYLIRMLKLAFKICCGSCKDYVVFFNKNLRLNDTCNNSERLIRYALMNYTYGDDAEGENRHQTQRVSFTKIRMPLKIKRFKLNL